MVRRALCVPAVPFSFCLCCAGADLWTVRDRERLSFCEHERNTDTAFARYACSLLSCRMLRRRCLRLWRLRRAGAEEQRERLAFRQQMWSQVHRLLEES